MIIILALPFFAASAAAFSAQHTSATRQTLLHSSASAGGGTSDVSSSSAAVQVVRRRLWSHHPHRQSQKLTTERTPCQGRSDTPYATHLVGNSRRHRDTAGNKNTMSWAQDGRQQVETKQKQHRPICTASMHELFVDTSTPISATLSFGENCQYFTKVFLQEPTHAPSHLQSCLLDSNLFKIEDV